MLYTLSEVITRIKMDLGFRDLPMAQALPDADIQWRIQNVVLKEFSAIYPYRYRCLIGEADRLCKPYTGIPTGGTTSYSAVYKLPASHIQEHHVIDVSYVDIQRPSGYNDLYVPQGMFADPASTMAAVASMQAIAALSRNFTHSLTWDFKQPDILVLYNGWTGGTYEVELLMDHDPSLSTIEPGAMDTFIQIAELDIKSVAFARLKRVQSLDTGIGSIELKVDDWADAAQQKRDLLNELSETAALDQLHIAYF